MYKFQFLHRREFLSPVHTEHIDASNQTNVKDRKHSHRPRRRASSASTNLHTSNERFQFKLYIGYWTSNNNKWPKCSCRYQTPSLDNTCANDVIDNDVTENDVIDSWMNMHILLASRLNVVTSTRRDALGVNGALGAASSLLRGSCAGDPSDESPQAYLLFSVRCSIQVLHILPMQI